MPLESGREVKDTTSSLPPTTTKEARPTPFSVSILGTAAGRDVRRGIRRGDRKKHDADAQKAAKTLPYPWALLEGLFPQALPSRGNAEDTQQNSSEVPLAQKQLCAGQGLRGPAAGLRRYLRNHSGIKQIGRGLGEDRSPFARHALLGHPAVKSGLESDHCRSRDAGAPGNRASSGRVSFHQRLPSDAPLEVQGRQGAQAPRHRPAPSPTWRRPADAAGCR